MLKLAAVAGVAVSRRRSGRPRMRDERYRSTEEN
jgi:hypothetical protein